VVVAHGPALGLLDRVGKRQLRARRDAHAAGARLLERSPTKRLLDPRAHPVEIDAERGQRLGIDARLRRGGEFVEEPVADLVGVDAQPPHSDTRRTRGACR
jgi:hypothetical protein